jgi:hypothetical protein
MVQLAELMAQARRIVRALAEDEAARP